MGSLQDNTRQAGLTATVLDQFRRCRDCKSLLETKKNPYGNKLFPFYSCSTCIHDYITKDSEFLGCRVCRGFHHHGSFTRVLPATWFDSPLAFARCRICLILDVNPMHEAYGAVRAHFTTTRSTLRAAAAVRPGAVEHWGIGYFESEPMTGSWGKPVYDEDNNPLRMPSVFVSYQAERRMDIWWTSAMSNTWTPYYATGVKPRDSPAADLSNQTFQAHCKQCLRARQAAGYFGFRKRADGTCDIPDTCLSCRGLLALYERCVRADLGVEGVYRRLMRVETGEIVHEDFGLE